VPVSPDFEEILIHGGRYFSAEWYRTAGGRMPAMEYYSALSEIDQDRFDDMIRYLCDLKPGRLLPKSMYRVEDRINKIYALKPRDARFFNFTTFDAKIIVTNAYHKHSQQMAKNDRVELEIAVRYRRDYERRVREETYYED
jgi:hypothetical protein